MKRILVLFVLASGACFAQALFRVQNVTAASSYVGPGDIQSGAKAWWGLRAYSAAKRGTKAVNVCDSGDAHCVDALTDATTGALIIPSSNPDCTSSGCTIKIRYDQSGGSNCGGSPCDMTQATEANRSVLVVNCLGSLPCAQSTVFAGPGGVSAAPITTLTQPYSISAVAARTSFFTSDVGVLYLKDGGGILEFTASANTVGIRAMTSLTASAADSTTHAIQALYNGTSSNLYVDGSANVGDAGTGSAGGTTNFQIQGDSAINNFGGNLFEAGVWAGDQSANNAAMNSNQRTYWGF